MITKTFELRDRGTFMPVLAVKLLSENVRDNYLLRRAGLGQDGSYTILLCDLNTGRAKIDPYAWSTGARTLPACHVYLEKYFDELATGTVIDIEFILGETAAPKESEWLLNPI